MNGPGARIVARSITLRSSRTLPGQSYCSSMPHRLVIDAGDRLLVAGVELGDERLDEQRQILLALAQRRQRHREHVQPVVQVLAQLALLHRLERDRCWWPRSRGRPPTARSARPAAGTPLLQHAQQLHLRRRRHLADLVEEERAAIGQLEAALPPIGGAGERALLVAEDLALEQRLGNRGAVDGDERERRRAG